MKAFLILLLLFPPLAVSAADTLPEQFLGNWTAFSSMNKAVYGDLEVRSDSLSFEKLGTHTLVVIATFDDSVVLEMSKSYNDGCGRYIRLGPIIQTNSDSIDSLFVGYLIFAVYEKKDEALAPKRINPATGKLEYIGDCSWGLYSP